MAQRTPEPIQVAVASAVSGPGHIQADIVSETTSGRRQLEVNGTVKSRPSPAFFVRGSRFSFLANVAGSATGTLSI
ncbi:hypothetical protein K438DRAFT_1854517 [Mycena galopus ATCC 62051]|nr:hypothetical protein K438DRAFT_1854517 [Mycena galopus ATCC 62051]